MNLEEMGFISYLRRIVRKETTLWSKMRKIAFLLLESPLKRVIDVILIAVYLAMSTVVDLETLESRPTALVSVSRTGYLTFMYSQNVWFSLLFVLGFISKDFKTKQETKYLNNFLNLLDIVIAVGFFASPRLMGFLCVFRIFRLIGYLMEMDRFEFLKELVVLVRQTFLTTVSIIGVMVVCILFLSVLLNSLAVARSNLRTPEKTCRSADT